VRCPTSGWHPHDLGWLPKQPYAWVSIRAKCGRRIVERVQEPRSSLINSNIPKSLFRAGSIVSKQSRYRGRLSRSQFGRGRTMTDPDLLETKMAEPFFSSLKPRNPSLGRMCSKAYPRSVVSSTKTKEGHSRNFIEHNFNDESKIPRRNKPTKLQHYIHIPMNFTEISKTEEVKTKELSSVPRNNSKISLTRSKTFSNQFTPRAENKSKSPSLEKGKQNHCRPDHRESNSVKEVSPRKEKSDQHKLCIGDRRMKSVKCRNQSSLVGRVSLILPASKLQTEEAKMCIDSKSSSNTMLTPTSGESKLKSKSGVQSEQEDDKFKLERKNRRLEGMREIATYQKWLSQGLESPVGSPEDPYAKTSEGECFRRPLRSHNIEKRCISLVTEPAGVKKNRSEAGKRRAGKVVFSRPSRGLDNSRTASRGFSVDSDSPDGILCKADV